MHQTSLAPDTWLCVSRAAAAAVRKAEAVCHHHPTPVNGLGQMITTAAVAAALAIAPLKLSAHAQTHAFAFNSPRQRCAKAQSIRGQGGGGWRRGGKAGDRRDETAHLFAEFILSVFFFSFVIYYL